MVAFKTVEETLQMEDFEFFKYVYEAYKYREFYTAVENSPAKPEFMVKLRKCRQIPEINEWRDIQQKTYVKAGKVYKHDS